MAAEDRYDRHDRMLDEIAEAAMKLARNAAARAEEAESGSEAAEQMAAFERMARSVRLSIMLLRRLDRDRRADRAEAVEVRKKQIRAAVLPALRAKVRNPNERFEREIELDHALAEEALYDGFTRRTLEAAVRRIAARFDLTVEEEPAANDPRPSQASPDPQARAGPS